MQQVPQERGAHIPVLPTPLTRTRTRDVLRPGSFLAHRAPFAFSRSSQATEIQTAAGTTCGKCGSSKASSWRISPDVPGGKVCKKCWHQDKSTSKKQKK